MQTKETCLFSIELCSKGDKDHSSSVYRDRKNEEKPSGKNVVYELHNRPFCCRVDGNEKFSFRSGRKTLHE